MNPKRTPKASHRTPTVIHNPVAKTVRSLRPQQVPSKKGKGSYVRKKKITLED